MRRPPSLQRLVLALCLAMVSALRANEASADPPSVELAAKVGAGTNPLPDSPNPLAFGMGGRAGLSFFDVYAGASVMYYFGATGKSAPGLLFDTSRHSLVYGVELGYGLRFVKILTLRPYLGVGNYTLTETTTVSPTSESSNALYLEPGVVALVALGSFFIGADANALILPAFSRGQEPSSTLAAFTMHAQVGVKF